jgi:hypothetical protein
MAYLLADVSVALQGVGDGSWMHEIHENIANRFDR